MSFYTGTQAELIYNLPAPVTNASFTTQRVISAPGTAQRAVIPAGYFSYSDKLLVKAWGTCNNAATGGSFANVLAWDPTGGTLGSAIASFPALVPPASTTVVWELEAWLQQEALGSPTGLTLQCNGKWRQSVVATATFGTANTEAMFNTSLTGLNSEALAVIELWSTSSITGTTISVNQFDVLGLN